MFCASLGLLLHVSMSLFFLFFHNFYPLLPSFCPVLIFKRRVLNQRGERSSISKKRTKSKTRMVGCTFPTSVAPSCRAWEQPVIPLPRWRLILRPPQEAREASSEDLDVEM